MRTEQDGRSGSEELLLRVAWFYYKDELTQDEIAKRLSVSRASVGRMLDRARKVGLVTLASQPAGNREVSGTPRAAGLPAARGVRTGGSGP